MQAGSWPPPRVTVGLAWDVTGGVNIDLDASIIVLDASLKVLDLVFFGNLKSQDGAIGARVMSTRVSNL